MSETGGKTPWKIRRVLLFAGILFILLLLGTGLVLAVSPFAIRTIWLPRVAAAAGVRASVEKLSFESIFPLRLKGTGLLYSDSETTVEIHSFSTRIRTSKLKRHTLELRDTSIDGLRVINRIPAASDPAERPPSGPGAASVRAPEETPEETWTFSMKRFQVKDAAFRLANRERQTVMVWSAESLNGDLFRTGETCSLTAVASVVVHRDRHNPLEIRSLPFRIQAKYRLDGEYRLREFMLKLKTGICDLSVTDEIKVPRQAGIRAEIAMTGSRPTPESLQITKSDIRLFKGNRHIGRLQFRSSFAERFQCSGEFSELDLAPYLSILAPNSKVRMIVRHAEFAVTGSDFSPEGIRRDLKARLIAKMKNISFPVELNRQSRFLRLIMIPVEAMPTFLELLELKWDLRQEMGTCLRSIQAIVDGRENLNFNTAELDLALENGSLKMYNFMLLGPDIKMESIKGSLELASGKLDISTVLIVGGLQLPLKFQGTLNEPSPRFKEAVKEFLRLNMPLLKQLESLLTEPPSDEDSQLEKNLKRGFRELNRYLKQ